MKITDIRKEAKRLGVETTGMNKTDMIRAIQVAEGNFPCFKTATDYCDQLNCSWRDDCLPQK